MILLSPHKVRLYTSKKANSRPNLEDWLEWPLDQIFSNFSTLKLPEAFPTSEQYPAVIHRLEISKIRIAFSLESEQRGIDFFKKEYGAVPSNYIELKTAVIDAQYEICAEDGYYFVRPIETNFILFRRLNGYDERTANQLMKNLEIIAQWHHIKALRNPYTSIRDDDIKLSLYDMNEECGSEYETSEGVLIKDFLSDEIRLTYQQRELQNDSASEWIEPAFRLKIENSLTNAISLWVSVLYMGSDFSIMNELCPLRELKPGQYCWLESRKAAVGCYTNDIFLHVQEEYLNQGIREITEHFKVLIATDEFNTHSLNQSGLPLEAYLMNNKRGLHRKERIDGINSLDWKAIDFAVKVVRPGE